MMNHKELLEFLDSGHTDVQAALDWLSARALTPEEARKVVAFLNEELEVVAARHSRVFYLRTLINSTFHVTPPEHCVSANKTP